MTRERDIFLQALQQPSAEARATFLIQATAGDRELQEAVESLLANNQADTFLEPGTVVLNQRTLARSETEGVQEERIGEFIGRYRLLEIIGEGGFGVVYRAEQSEPVRRQVALKVIRLGMDTRSVVARFEAERQALALMDHPSIARVLDGGATPSGRPYFVMELVRGVRITEYCEANQTPLKERLSLFIQLCHAIQHAHQKGIIHRDLKPSNVLVTVLDGGPLPKVIDFGIAKAIAEPLTPKTILTEFHAFIGTPAYTSPEQAEITGSNVDTRSDIYSLGVLLYELLTGVTPFDAEELVQSGLDAMRRTIKHVDPPTPSTRARRVVAGRPIRPESLLIDRDLDWIVMKCLEKDRARRYPTAQELASDLERYLNQEPVLARPQSAAYRLRKAMERHRTAFAAAAAVFLVTIAGTGFSVWQAVRATRAEQTAKEGRAREEVLRLSAERERESALESKDRAELNEYVADVNLAHQSILSGNISRANALLARHRVSGVGRFEWRYLWNEAQGDDHRVVVTEPSSVLSLAVSAEFLAVGLRDRVNIYNPKTGILIKNLAKPGNSIALSKGGLLATAGNGSVRVWRTADWAETLSLTNQSAPVAFSGDGTLMAVNSNGGVMVLESSTGKTVSYVPDSRAPFAFSPTGNTLAVDANQGILLWDLSADSRLRLLSDSKGMFNHSAGWMRDRKALAFSPDGRLVVAARNTLKNDSVFVLDVWISETGAKDTGMPVQPNLIEHTGTIAEVAFAPIGQLMASAGWDHSIRLWTLAQRQCLRTLQGNPSEVWSLAFTADGKGILTGGKDGAVRLWPTDPQERTKFHAGSWTPVRFSNKGDVLAVVDANSKLVSLNLRTGEPEAQVQLARTPPGSMTPAISDDLRVMVEPSPAGFEVRDLQTLQSVTVTNPDTPRMWALIAPDGASFLAAGKQDSLLWWNLQELSDPPLRLSGKAALFSGDGRVLVTMGAKGFGRWDAKTRTLNAEFSIDPAYSHFAAFALSPDGGVLAAGSEAVSDPDNVTRLWETKTGRLLGICRGHTQGVRWLAFAPEGETLASVSDDSTLRFWNVRTQQELFSVRQLANPMKEIRFSPDGNWLAAKTAKGLQLFDATPRAVGE